MRIYVINHLTSYLCKHIVHFPPSRLIVINQLICFYNCKSSYLMVQPACLGGKEKLLSNHYFISGLVFNFRSFIVTMLLIRHRRLAFQCLIPDPKALVSSSTPIPSPTIDIQVELFYKFMQIYINRVQVSVAIPAEARNNIDRLFKSWNPDLYHSNSNIEYYYFCW